jgi:ABC-type multidrug transport system ATPase subunit
MSVAIKLDGLSKTHRRRRGRPAAAAVTCLCLSIPAGQVQGLLGHAGAGKTTTLKLIGGMLKPTAGRVLVNGHDVVRESAAARRQVHVALEENPDLYARALLAKPILLLDEPALGPDPLALKERLRTLACEHGKTVVLATQCLDVARGLCDRVAVLSQGRLVAEREARFLEDGFLGRAFYQIRVKGYLKGSWSEWFEDLALTPAGDGEMVLSGPIVDQAALHGVLARLRDLGLPLLSVSRCDLDLGATFACAPDGRPKAKISQR